MNLRVLFISSLIGFFCLFLLNVSPYIIQTPEKKDLALTVKPKNVLGTALQACCTEPMTGFYRDGFCSTGNNDYGVHVVCAVVTEEFLAYSKGMGNDLTKALPPPSSFRGLRPGDKWCLCASRWVEGMKEGHAPKIILESTHEKMLAFVDMETLRRYAY